MPIDKYAADAPKLTRIGKLVKGAPKTEGGVGQDLDHFRFVSPRPEVVEAFYSVYDAQPREINVYLPFATAAQNFDYWLKLYGTGSLKRKCTGTTCVQQLTKTGNYDYSQVPCICAAQSLPDGHPERCVETAELYVVVDELVRMGFIGAVAVTTKSHNDIPNLRGELLFWEQMFGDLRGRKFKLIRKPEQISKKVKNSRMRGESWLLSIIPEERYVVGYFAEQERKALLLGSAPTPKLLPAPSVDVETGLFEDNPTDEASFFVLAGDVVGTTWESVVEWWGDSPPPKPTTPDEWAELYDAVRSIAAAPVE
jgi:hypothetical protein